MRRRTPCAHPARCNGWGTYRVVNTCKKCGAYEIPVCGRHITGGIRIVITLCTHGVRMCEVWDDDTPDSTHPVNAELPSALNF